MEIALRHETAEAIRMRPADDRDIPGGEDLPELLEAAQ